MAQFKPIGYQQWRQRMLDTTPADELVRCPDCRGDGYTECCECGSDRECETCEDGKVRFCELDSTGHASLFSRTDYLQAVAADGIAWARWCGQEPFRVLASAGFRVYSQVRDRALQIDFNQEGVRV